MLGPHTPIAIFRDGDTPLATTIEHQCACDDGFADLREEISEALGTGQPYQHGGAGAAFTVIGLKHRDAPMNAAHLMDLDQMSTLLEMFCAAYALPFASADELLAEVSHHDLISTSVINWLSNYIDAWFEVQERIV